MQTFTKNTFITGAVLVLLTIVLSALSGCAPYRPYKSHPELIGYTETGRASFYSMKFQFRRTASGETFNNMGMTAAHRSLPFGTRVLVTNVDNGSSAIVRINDRGPHVEGRIIDLTRFAFSKIADADQGAVAVKIKVIE